MSSVSSQRCGSPPNAHMRLTLRERATISMRPCRYNLAMELCPMLYDMKHLTTRQRVGDGVRVRKGISYAILGLFSALMWAALIWGGVYVYKMIVR